jgi:hypothetical protein
MEEKKKGGRKKKLDIEDRTNIIMVIEETESAGGDEMDDSRIVKKRGRKPKGGKITVKPPEKVDPPANTVNIILHLKCSMADLNEHNNKLNQIMKDPLTYNPVIPPNIMTYNNETLPSFSLYDTDQNEPGGTNEDAITDVTTAAHSGVGLAYDDFASKKHIIGNICQCCNDKMGDQPADTTTIKEINAKLKNLKIQLYKNTNHDKKAACFWCTYEYDNQTCYIPKYETDGEIYGYGSFCRPECAVAFLMKENIDDSLKFERYHLLNQAYSKVYKFKRNIKPAPNPYYLLDKFYGNLTIQEYRKLLKTEYMLLVVDKPMTRILPELHEDNDDFIVNVYGGSGVNAVTTTNTGLYKVKRQSEKQKGPSKNTIIKQNFGLSS